MRKMYSVYDSKVGAYLDPIFLRSKGEAIRMFQTTVTTEDNNFSKFPEDFTLFELGEFDEEKAQFKLHNTPISLGVAVEFIQKPQGDSKEPRLPIRELPNGKSNSTPDNLELSI